MKYTSDEIQPAQVEEASLPFDNMQSEVEAAEGTYSALQMHFLARLERLREAKKEIEAYATEDPFLRRLVDRGLFATFRECVDEGVGQEARHLLHI